MTHFLEITDSIYVMMLMKGLILMTLNDQQTTTGFTIRHAEPQDASLILDFIKALAIYEHLEHRMTATLESISHSLFVLKSAEVIIGEYHGVPVAFALFYPNYSTFLGKANLFLEDLYVLEPYRKQGFGKKIFYYLAHLAVERGCERLDWWCLDWNAPAIEFYHRLGAKHLKEWTIFRLEHDQLKKIALLNQKG